MTNVQQSCSNRIAFEFRTTNEFSKRYNLYENFRNTALDAAGYFATKTPVEHQNEFGGTIGGPIIKNRLFFFFNYDGYRYKAGSNPVYTSIPTLRERNGDFGELSTPIYDPSTTVCAGGVCTRQAFPGNKLPAISPVSAFLQSKMPTKHKQPSDVRNCYWTGKLARQLQLEAYIHF